MRFLGVFLRHFAVWFVVGLSVTVLGKAAVE